MNEEFNKYGTRTTASDHEKHIRNLYKNVPAVPDKRQDEALRREELELLIDHKLGGAFPADKRELLWQAKKQFDKYLPLYAIGHVFKAAMTGKNDFMPGKLVTAYAKILDDEDLDQLLGPSEERVLPPVFMRQPK